MIYMHRQLCSYMINTCIRSDVILLCRAAKREDVR